MQKVGRNVPKHVETDVSIGRTNMVRFVRISIERRGSVLDINPSHRATKFFSAALSASHSNNDFRVWFYALDLPIRCKDVGFAPTWRKWARRQQRASNPRSMQYHDSAGFGFRVR
jgi:hypothetical protein